MNWLYMRNLNTHKRTKKKYIKRKQKQRQQRKSRKLLKGGAPFENVTQIHNPEDMFNITPGDYYTFFGFHMKFYDFDIPDHNKYKDILKKTNIGEPCQWKIQKEYFYNAVDKSRFAITLTYFDGKEYIDSFILCDQLSINELYVSLTCSRKIFSDEKYEEAIALDKSNKGNLNKGNINMSFGLFLRCVILTYAKSIGFTNVYNDASESDLIPYYTRFGFRLGKNKCGTEDKITEKHESAILKKTEKEFYASVNTMTDNDSTDLYETKSGFRMKLQGIDVGYMCSHAHKKLKENWSELEKYKDIYNGD